MDALIAHVLSLTLWMSLRPAPCYLYLFLIAEYEMRVSQRSNDQDLFLFRRQAYGNYCDKHGRMSMRAPTRSIVHYPIHSELPQETVTCERRKHRCMSNNEDCQYYCVI